MNRLTLAPTLTTSINMQYRIAIDFQIENETIIPINIGDRKLIYG